MNFIDRLKSFFKAKPIGSTRRITVDLDNLFENASLQHHKCGGRVGNPQPHFKANGDFCCEWLTCETCAKVFHQCKPLEMEDTMEMFGGA